MPSISELSVSTLDALAQSALGSSLVRALAALGERTRVGRGTVLVEAGQPLERLALCLNGDLLVLHPLAGRLVPVEQAGRGVLIGLETACQPTPRHALTIRVVRPAEVVWIALPRFRQALDENPELALAVFGVLASRLHSCIAAIETQKFVPARLRLARYLMAVLDGGSCVLPIPKKDVAALLGMTQQSLSRLLRDLREDGIDVQGNAIRCRDRDHLRRLCDPEEIWCAKDFAALSGLT